MTCARRHRIGLPLRRSMRLAHLAPGWILLGEGTPVGRHAHPPRRVLSRPCCSSSPSRSRAASTRPSRSRSRASSAPASTSSGSGGSRDAAGRVRAQRPHPHPGLFGPPGKKVVEYTMVSPAGEVVLTLTAPAKVRGDSIVVELNYARFARRGGSGSARATAPASRRSRTPRSSSRRGGSVRFAHAPVPKRTAGTVRTRIFRSW